MRTIMISGAALLLSTAALPAAAAPASNVVTLEQATTQNDQATEQPRARDNSRRICVRETMSNSRLARRVCRTQAEWDEMRRTGELVSDR